MARNTDKDREADFSNINNDLSIFQLTVTQLSF